MWLVWLWCVLTFTNIGALPQTLETVTSSVDLAEGISPNSQHSDSSASGKSEQDELDVKELVTASYKGLTYVMVKNLSLGFSDAERYCADELSDPMHLASVQSEQEWKMLTKVFGTPYPSEFWLGGTVQRSDSRIFLLRWLDGLPFTYHKFPTSERKRWLSNWRLNSQGCILGNLQSNGLGNWTAELTPCTEPKAFVCKETRKPNAQPMNLMLAPSMFAFRHMISSLLTPPFMAPWHFGGAYHEIQRPPMRFQIQKIPAKQQSTTQSAASTERNTLATSTEFPQTTVVVPETTMALQETTQPPQTTTETFSTTLQTENDDAPAVTESKILRNEVSEGQPFLNEPALPVGRSKIITRPTFSVFSSAPHAKDSAKEKPEKRIHTAPTNSEVPNIATQVIYPNTLWDLTYPEEPKWLTVRNTRRAPRRLSQ